MNPFGGEVLKLIRATFILSFVILIVTPSILPDSVDFLLTVLTNKKIGRFYIPYNLYFLLILFAAYFLTSFLLGIVKVALAKTRNPIKKSYVILCLLLLIVFIVPDFFLTKAYDKVLIAYGNVLLPFFVFYLAFKETSRCFRRTFLGLLYLVYFFIVFQVIYFSLVNPRISWTHEIVQFLGFRIHRVTVTSGPATATSFIIIALYVLLKTLEGNTKLIKLLTVLAVVSVFLTLTRTALIIISIMVVKDILSFRLRKADKLPFFAAILLLFLLIFFLLFINRWLYGHGVEGDRYRLLRLTEAVQIYKKGDILHKTFGTGFGTSYTRQISNISYLENVEDFYLKSPHNTHVILINEIGFLRLSILCIIFAFLVRKAKTPLKEFIVLTLVVGMNTEVIYIYHFWNWAFIATLAGAAFEM